MSGYYDDKLAAERLRRVYELGSPITALAVRSNNVIKRILDEEKLLPEEIGLTPLAMVLGGVLAEFIPIRLLIYASFILTFLTFLPLAFSPAIRRYVNFDPDRDTLESIS